ncbi:MAG: PilZ domain-containing protein [Pseudomonadota bacterium]
MNNKSLLRAVYDAPDMRAIERSYVEMEAFYLPSGAAPVACRISNISPMGAQVSFSGAHAVPEDIRLRVPHIGLIFDAEVKWQEGDRLGVQFTGSEREDDPLA